MSARPASKTRTRCRPAAFAACIAVSAWRSSSSADAVGEVATPIEAVRCTSPSETSYGASSAAQQIDGELPGGGLVDVLADDQELVAGEAGDRVGRADAGRPAGPPPGRAARRRRRVPTLVDVLELVEVHEEHGGGHGLAHECVLEAIEEQRPVREPGQGVVQGRAAQLVLELSRIGHVGDHRERALDGPAEVVERRCRDPQRAPSPVRVVVVDLVAFRLSLRRRGPVAARRVRGRQEIAHRELAARRPRRDPRISSSRLLAYTVRPSGAKTDSPSSALSAIARYLDSDARSAASARTRSSMSRRFHRTPPTAVSRRLLVIASIHRQRALDVAHPQRRGLGGALAEHPLERSQGRRAVLGVDLIGGGELDEVLGGPADERAQRRRAVETWPVASVTSARSPARWARARKKLSCRSRRSASRRTPLRSWTEAKTPVWLPSSSCSTVPLTSVGTGCASGPAQHPLGHARCRLGGAARRGRRRDPGPSGARGPGPAAHQRLGRSADEVAEGRVGVGQPARGVPLHLRHRGQLELGPTEHRRLAERRVQATQVVDVDRVADDGAHVRVVAVVGQHLPDQPPVVGRVGEPVLHDLAAGAARRDGPRPRRRALPVVRVGQRQQRGSDQLLAGPADLPHGAGGRRRQHAVRRPPSR